MLKATYDWTMRLAAHPRAGLALFGVAFAESSFFPIPPDVMLVPMVLAKRAKAWAYAAVCTVGSVLGALAGYAIGFFLFEYIGRKVLALYGHGDAFDAFAQTYNEWGPWIVLMGGMTPFPFKVITILSGATHMNVIAFALVCVVARGMRFFPEAALLYWFGEPIRAFIEKRLALVSTVFVVLLVGGFAAVKFLV